MQKIVYKLYIMYRCKFCLILLTENARGSPYWVCDIQACCRPLCFPVESYPRMAGFGVYEPRFYGYLVNEVCHVKFIDMLWFLFGSCINLHKITTLRTVLFSFLLLNLFQTSEKHVSQYYVCRPTGCP